MKGQVVVVGLVIKRGLCYKMVGEVCPCVGKVVVVLVIKRGLCYKWWVSVSNGRKGCSCSGN